MITVKKQNGACKPEIEIAIVTPSYLSDVGMFHMLSFLFSLSSWTLKFAH